LIIFSLEAVLWGECWNYFRAQFGSVHAFGYNSTESEPIWMKFGALWIHWRLAWQILGVILPVAIASEPGEILGVFVR